jgi:hypothetical protein
MTLTIDAVIRSYLTLRDQRKQIETDAKNKAAEITTKLDKLEAWIRQQAEAQGVTSFKTTAGTAFLTTTDFANVADWDAVLAHIKANNAYDLLERRVAKAAVRAHIDTSGDVPPGVNYGTRLDVNVRRPAARADD